jgi:hypothetical protein
MANTGTGYRVIFPDCYDERAEFEAPRKGWLPGVVVQLEDGTRFPLLFMDPVRLAQDLEGEAQTGRPYFAEPGLVVLPEVTTQAILAAVPGLVRDGFFLHLKPAQ